MNDFNISQLETHTRKVIAAERTASHWLHQKRIGRMSRHDIVKKLDEQPPEQAQLLRDALNKYRHKVAA